REINGKHFGIGSQVRNINGKLNGAIGFDEDDTKAILINGGLITQIDGKKILSAHEVFNVGNLLNGRIELETTLPNGKKESDLYRIVLGKIVGN
ncbi:MAG: hypothetical protein MUC28_04185, partial [Planctomycetes bacterium]|nr:hypothetical protein [Planctomycetota bacterium]